MCFSQHHQRDKNDFVDLDYGQQSCSDQDENSLVLSKMTLTDGYPESLDIFFIYIGAFYGACLALNITYISQSATVTPLSGDWGGIFAEVFVQDGLGGVGCGALHKVFSANVVIQKKKNKTSESSQ